MTRAIGLLGGGSQADETAEFDPESDVVFRAVSADRLAQAGEGFIDIATEDPRLLGTPVVAAVGAPGLRRTLVRAWRGTEFASVVSPAASVSPTASVGAGCIVAPGAVITHGAVLGRHVIVNVGASVSHTSVIGDFTTISPGARIAGDCTVGEGSFVGIGAIVSHGVSIVAGTVLGAGAVVVDDIDVAGVYVGVPARRVRTLDDWLYSL
jgi:sugar O-acyltransferase (sialic acid O-acetyltransferase NeuD family)